MRRQSQDAGETLLQLHHEIAGADSRNRQATAGAITVPLRVVLTAPANRISGKPPARIFGLNTARGLRPPAGYCRALSGDSFACS